MGNFRRDGKGKWAKKNVKGHNRADLSLVMFNQQCNLRAPTIIIIKTHTCDIKRREEWIGFSIASRSGFFSDSFHLLPHFPVFLTTTYNSATLFHS